MKKFESYDAFNCCLESSDTIELNVKEANLGWDVYFKESTKQVSDYTLYIVVVYYFTK